MNNIKDIFEWKCGVEKYKDDFIPDKRFRIQNSKYTVIKNDTRYDKEKVGDIVKLIEDDNTDCPYFIVLNRKNMDDSLCIYWSQLLPYQEN